MHEDHTAQLQDLLDRLREGDTAACEKLIEFACERLRCLAKKMLHVDFPRLEHLHETGSVLDEAVLKLLPALRQEQPASVAGFFALAALQIRRVLLDMARQYDRRPVWVPLDSSTDSGARGGTPPPAAGSDDPLHLAMWTEFHQAVEQLPEAERKVFEYHWYLGMSKAKVAQILGIHEKQGSRLWIRAVRKLPHLPE